MQHGIQVPYNFGNSCSNVPLMLVLISCCLQSRWVAFRHAWGHAGSRLDQGVRRYPEEHGDHVGDWEVSSLVVKRGQGVFA